MVAQEQAVRSVSKSQHSLGFAHGHPIPLLHSHLPSITRCTSSPQTSSLRLPVILLYPQRSSISVLRQVCLRCLTGTRSTYAGLPRYLVQSAHIFQAVAPALYANVKLRGVGQCLRTLDMLSSRPDRARHVRTLSVRPDYQPLGAEARAPWGRPATADGYAVSAAVRRAASQFEILQRFIWDGEELPPYDDMWFALRVL